MTTLMIIVQYISVWVKTFEKKLNTLHMNVVDQIMALFILYLYATIAKPPPNCVIKIPHTGDTE